MSNAQRPCWEKYYEHIYMNINVSRLLEIMKVNIYWCKKWEF